MAEKQRPERDEINKTEAESVNDQLDDLDDDLDAMLDAEATEQRWEPRITGIVAAECGPVLSARCPWCRQIHCRPLGRADHLEIRGRRYWREVCGSRVFVVQVEGVEIVAALAEARRITAQEGLSQVWLDQCAPPRH